MLKVPSDLEVELVIVLSNLLWEMCMNTFSPRLALVGEAPYAPNCLCGFG
jgi:hypothetical protein